MPKPKRSLKAIWKGPEEDGITQSLLSRFLCCRERFRLLVVEGLKPAPSFEPRIEYGSMWHICEEFHDGDWAGHLKTYAQMLMMKYVQQGTDVEKWYQVCKTQFPIYQRYWAKHPDVKQRTVLMPETVFKVPYLLPSGRVVTLRGKWDSVDRIGSKKTGGIYLQENKTKGDIDEQKMKRQLQFDLQTLFYLVALREHSQINPSGIRYNVVRRPLSGGVGSIRPHQATKTKPAETAQEFYARLGGIIQESPEYFFMRWKAEILPEDLTRFEWEFLIPVLESLWDWWEWITSHPKDYWEPAGKLRAGNHIHWRFPYGVWNPLLEGRSSELDEYLSSGSELGLARTSNLFGELDDANDQ